MGWRDSVAWRSLTRGFSPFLPYQYWRKRLCSEFGHFVVWWWKFTRFGQLVIEWKWKSQTGHWCPDGRNMGESLSVRGAPDWRDIVVPTSQMWGNYGPREGKLTVPSCSPLGMGNRDLGSMGGHQKWFAQTPLPLVRFYLWTRIVRRARPDWRFKRRKE